MFSEGMIFLISLTTDMDPKPESKTAMGRYNTIDNLDLTKFKLIIYSSDDAS
jgi:hypothetical protein